MIAVRIHLETMTLPNPKLAISGVDSTPPISMLPSKAGRLIMFNLHSLKRPRRYSLVIFVIYTYSVNHLHLGFYPSEE